MPCSTRAQPHSFKAPPHRHNPAQPQTGRHNALFKQIPATQTQFPVQPGPSHTVSRPHHTDTTRAQPNMREALFNQDADSIPWSTGKWTCDQSSGRAHNERKARGREGRRPEQRQSTRRENRRSDERTGGQASGHAGRAQAAASGQAP